MFPIWFFHALQLLEDYYSFKLNSEGKAVLDWQTTKADSPRLLSPASMFKNDRQNTSPYKAYVLAMRWINRTRMRTWCRLFTSLRHLPGSSPTHTAATTAEKAILPAWASQGTAPISAAEHEICTQHIFHKSGCYVQWIITIKIWWNPLRPEQIFKKAIFKSHLIHSAIMGQSQNKPSKEELEMSLQPISLHKVPSFCPRKSLPNGCCQLRFLVLLKGEGEIHIVLRICKSKQ